MDWKHDLYKKIAPHVAPHAIVASNTSGLSITKLAEALPERAQAALLRHPLLQPAALHAPGRADPDADDASRRSSTSSRPSSPRALGKGVVRAKDTPNFVANRVGIAGMLATMHEAEKFGLTLRRRRRPDRQEARPRQRRAPSAPPTWSAWTRWRTSSRRCRTTCRTTRSIPTLQDARGAGRADRAGRARPEDRRRLLQEGRQGHPAPRPGKGDYVPAGGKADADRRAHPEEAAGRAPEAAARVEQPAGAVPVGDPARLASTTRPCIWPTIADTARDVDFAMRWGFGSQQGPFELWQAAGWKQVAQWIKEDIDAGKALSNAPLPAWVFDGRRRGVHTPEGSWSAGAATLRAAQHAAGLRAPALPRERARRGRRASR